MNKKRAVVLLSGGVDSATTAAIAIERGFELTALIFFYGQKHKIEIESAIKLTKFFKIRDYIVIEIPSRIFQSALTAESVTIPKNRDILSEDDIPVTYVPARNIIFLSYGLAYAESISARYIFIGANTVDYSGYPDCRPEFFRSFQEMANIGTKAGITGNGFSIETPLLKLSKPDIIKKGSRLGVDYSLTHSCYDPDPDGYSCGKCDSCLIRKRGFMEAGLSDPARYQSI